MAKAEFFKNMASLGLAVTYDDVRLQTGYSEHPPAEVDLKTRFTRRVSLNIPVVSAAMDTVTEQEMAIEIAKLGGIGVIHRGIAPETQASQVKRTKLFLNGLIERPITVQAKQTVEEVHRMRLERRWSFHSFPVIGENGRLVGVLTRNDFDFCTDPTLSVAEIMTTELVTAPVDTPIDEAYEIMSRERKKLLPLVDEEHRLHGMYIYSDVKRIKTGSSIEYNVDAEGRLRTAADIGVGEGALERLALMARYLDVAAISTAHGDSRNVLWTVHEIKKLYGDRFDIYVGNVSESESAKRLLDAGADGIGVGQGPGSICTTRIVAGIGCPQVTAVYNCVTAIAGSDVPVCADGGIRYSGDIPVAIGAGAHSVMMGRVLAGTREAPGDIQPYRGAPVKMYRGMGSLSAMEASSASRERYRQGDMPSTKLVPEGIEGVVPFQGDLKDVLHQYLGGLRAGMGYVGAANIEELREKADFHRITGAGVVESHPHDIIITTDAPNYKRRDGT
jgi:IMP dehydrogenase